MSHGWLALKLLTLVQMTLNCSTPLNSMRLAAVPRISDSLCDTSSSPGRYEYRPDGGAHDLGSRCHNRHTGSRDDLRHDPGGHLWEWGSESSAGIQAAIAACPMGQTVLLSAGLFHVNNHILIDKAITLRGAGPTLTTLRKTNGRSENSSSPENEAVVVIGPHRSQGDARLALSADGMKGNMSVTVASAVGFAAGQFVLLDEDDYAAGAWIPLPPRDRKPNPVTIWATDRVVFARHNPPAPRMIRSRTRSVLVQSARTTAERDQGDRRRQRPHDRIRSPCTPPIRPQSPPS